MLFSTSPKFEYNDIIKKMNYLTFSQKCKVIIENISKSQNYYLCNIVENNIQTMSEFVYSFPFITKYPFIKYKSEYFLISPVHIVESCTIHLQDQLTQGNNDIKTEIGKIFEEYIYKLALNTRNYKNNEIVNDSKGYKADGRVFPGEDLVLKENDRIFLISCKSFTTPLSYRLSKKSKIEEVEQRYIDALKQSYRYFSHCGDQYKPFGENIDYSDRYSIILIVHSSGVKFNDIIKKFSMKYKEKPHLDSFKERIVFLYLHDFEDLLLSNNYITDTILYNRNKGYYNVLELNINNIKLINNEYNIFYNRISDDSVELIKTLFQNIE